MQKQRHRPAAAYQCFGFLFIDSTIPQLHKSEIKPLAIFCGCTARFVSDLVGNPEDRFSHDAAHMCPGKNKVKATNFINLQ